MIARVTHESHEPQCPFLMFDRSWRRARVCNPHWVVKDKTVCVPSLRAEKNARFEVLLTGGWMVHKLDVKYA